MARRGIISRSPEETAQFGQDLGARLKAGSVVAFHGDLGAGKTTLLKGLISSLTEVSEGDISSPTFIYMNIYEGSIPLYHFDLYRLQNDKEFLSMGFEEYFYGPGITCIEWPERIAAILPKETLHVYIESLGEHERKIEVDDATS